MSGGRGLGALAVDSGPVVVLAAIAAAGSFAHIHDTAADHGQRGWMSWAIAVCIDLTCVMAARERQRDKRLGRVTRALSWPTGVLVGGVLLSLAANLAQAEPTVWGWVMAATPAGAFLVAVSMLERRAGIVAAVPSPSWQRVAPDGLSPSVPALDQAESNEAPSPAPALLDFARRVSQEHEERTGNAITRDALRSRLGVSNKLASDLLREVKSAS
jgi:uncharacterized protein DUF2637